MFFMELHVVANSPKNGTYRLLSSLSAEHLEVLERSTAPEPYFDEPDSEEPDMSEVLELIEIYTVDSPALTLAPAEQVFGCWWFSEDDCVHDLYCTCGPISLLEVLTEIAPHRRQAALDAHVDRLNKLWDHYWSGDALQSPNMRHLGTACAECLVNPQTHLAILHESAAEFSEYLGQALAAFQFQLTIGSPHWPQG